jgi:hypothetical protein
MKYRKLRIAWSLAWGVVAVLLCVLWVQSYRQRFMVGYNYQINYGFGTHTSYGRTTFSSYDARGYSGMPMIMTTGFYLKSFGIPPEDDDGRSLSQWGFGIKTKNSPATYLTVPHWSLVLMTTMLSGVPWLPWLPYRFSLRTLLIATTLVAIVLGLVVWASR